MTTVLAVAVDDVDALTPAREEERLVLLVPSHPVVLVLARADDLEDYAAPRRLAGQAVDLENVAGLGRFDGGHRRSLGRDQAARCSDAVSASGSAMSNPSLRSAVTSVR